MTKKSKSPKGEIIVQSTSTQIQAVAMIKKCVITDSIEIRFDSLHLTPEECEIIARWIANKDTLQIKLMQTQADLPYDEPTNRNE